MREQDLDELFIEARAQVPTGAEPLMMRVVNDALQVQPQTVNPVSKRHTKTGFWASILGMVGGKAGLTGLGAAAAMGVVLGFVQPVSLMTLTDTILAQTQMDEVDLIPGVDAILTEG